MIYPTAAADHGRDFAPLTPTFAGVSASRGSMSATARSSGRCDDEAPLGHVPIMHIEHLRARQGESPHHRLRADRPAGRAAASRCILTTGPHPQPVQCRRPDAAQPTTCVWHEGGHRLEIHPAADAEDRGITRRLARVRLAQPRRAGPRLRAKVTERVPPGVVYTDVPSSPWRPGANVVTTDNADWATSCPEYKVTAVEVTPSEPAGRTRQDGVRRAARARARRIDDGAARPRRSDRPHDALASNGDRENFPRSARMRVAEMEKFFGLCSR